MKTTTLLLLGAAGYLLYTKTRKAAAAPPPASTKDTETVAGALGAVMTGNPMLEELGSLGSANGYKLRHW